MRKTMESPPVRGAPLGTPAAVIIACPACDLAQWRPSRPVGRLRCVRCAAPLEEAHHTSIDAAVALTLTALVLFVVANLFPLVALVASGAYRQTTLVGAALGLYDQGYAVLAWLVFLTTFAAPLAQIVSLLYVLEPLRRGRCAPAQKAVFRLITAVRPWTFIEVFILGALVALVRLAAFAQVQPGISLWAYGLLMFTLVALVRTSSAQQFWRWAECCERSVR